MDSGDFWRPEEQAVIDKYRVETLRHAANMTFTELLESRHTAYLKWSAPWPACGPEGNELTAHVEYRATVHDCINMGREAARNEGLPTGGEDERYLLDFMAVHWATVVQMPPAAST